jgi:subtilase family serine protease
MRPRTPARSSLVSFLLTAGVVLSSAQSVNRPISSLDIAPPAAIGHSKDLGRSAAAQMIHLAISLPFRDQAGIEKFVDSVSNPSSPNYRQFLTPEQIGARFGLNQSDVDKVSSYLKSQGLTIRQIAKSRLTILADGTVAQAEKAFSVILHEYKNNSTDALEAPKFRAFTSSPKVPTDLKSLILDVAGLETYTRPKHQVTYLVPSQIRSLYNIKPLYSASVQGQGRTIAISSWDGFKLSYLPNVYTQWGLPTPAGGVGSNVTVVKLDNGSGSGTASGEADLDIQTILTVAPLCNFIIYDGGTTANGGFDYIGLLTKESDENKADIISESYGWDLSGSPSTATAAHNLHVTMNVQGITYIAASGDSGATIGRYSYPFYDPEVLLVGGTTAAVDANGVRSSETAWSGSGSGYVNNSATFNALPSYQKGNGVPTNIAKRLGPDLALNADPNTGYVIYFNGSQGLGFYVFGGTSAASPTFAAGLALAQQQMIALGTLPANGAGKSRHGRIQDLIYSFNGSPSLFFDVTSGSASGTMPNGATATAKAGWDFVTGWGAIDFKAFSATGTTPTTVSSVTVSPSTVVGGSSTAVTGTVTISQAAPAGGTTVTLSSSDASATVPASVSVPATKTTANFTITTSAVATAKSAVITAAIGTSTKTATLTVNPPAAPKSFTLTFPAAKVNSGETATGTVTLDNPAPAGGLVVSLASSRTSALTVPASITIAENTLSKTFTAQAKTVAAAVRVTVTLSRTGFTSVTATQTVLPPAVKTFDITPSPAVGGKDVTGTVTLSAAAPTGGVTVNVNSTDTLVSFPATFKVAAGQTTGTVTINTDGVSANKTIVVKASTTGTAVVSARLTLTPAALSAVTATPNPVTGGLSVTGTVTLNGKAPTGGLVISLVSASTALTVPSSVTIPAGDDHVDFNGTTTVVSRDTSAKITATLGSARGVFVVVTVKK